MNYFVFPSQTFHSFRWSLQNIRICFPMQQPFTPRVLNIKPRRAPVALLLSVFFPGLGQMYNGQFRKGLLFFGLLSALQVVYGFMHDSLSINGVFGFMVSILLLRALCILDAIPHARLQKAYTPKFYNTRGYYIVVMIIMALLKLFSMPSIKYNASTK